MIDLSIVVVSWNTRELTLATLRSLQRLCRSSPLATELWLIDNGSRDGTARAARERAPEVRIFASPRNLGFAAGANRGLQCARGRHVLLLNSDALPLPGALETCVAYLDAHPEVALVGPRLLRSDGSIQRSLHAVPGLRSELLPWLAAARRPHVTRPCAAPALRGAALFLRASVLREVGGLCEDYFFFLEETEWCLRLRRAGHRIVHHPGAAVRHLSGASSKRVHPSRTRIEYHRSLYRFLRVYRGRGVERAVRALRVGKAALRTALMAPIAWLWPARRDRWRSQWDLLAWHWRGRPEDAGLEMGG